MGEWLEGYGTEVEGQALERGTGGLGFVDSGACAGRVGIFRGPFGMCDLRELAWGGSATRGALTYSLSVFLPITSLQPQALSRDLLVLYAQQVVLSRVGEALYLHAPVVDHGKFRTESPTSWVHNIRLVPSPPEASLTAFLQYSESRGSHTPFLTFQTCHTWFYAALIHEHNKNWVAALPRKEAC